jgi:hypothetical protein
MNSDQLTLDRLEGSVDMNPDSPNPEMHIPPHDPSRDADFDHVHFERVDILGGSELFRVSAVYDDSGSDSEVEETKQRSVLQAAREIYIAAARAVQNRDVEVAITRDDIESKSFAIEAYVSPRFSEMKKIELPDDPI